MAVKPVRKVESLKQDTAPRAQPDAPDDELRRRIAEIAYYRAQQRGFSPGYELDDWLAAEAQVRSGALV